MDGQRLALLDARRLAMQRDYEGAHRLLESDLRFWRLVFESADTLITKMIATAALLRHSERSMRRCMLGEWMFASNLARSLSPLFDPEIAMEGRDVGRKVVAVMGRPLYQSQDMINRYADYYSRVAELLDAPLSGYAEARSSASEFAARNQKGTWPPRSSYNVVGSWIFSQGVADYSDYGARAADVEGVRRAALAAVTLRAAKVETADIVDALKVSEWRSPYDGQPFEWSATDTAIRFQGLAEGERGVHLLYY